MSRLTLLFLFAVSLTLAACTSGTDQPVDGRDVIEAMHDRYADAWYETVTFVQTTIQYQRGADPDTTLWWEAIRIPGELRIDIGGPDTGEGMVFRNDSLFMMRGNQVAGSGPTMHPLLILGFDVYGQSAEETIAKLDTIGFNLDAMHPATWQDRDVWVIGTDEPGDTEAPQFWIDQERLVFVRLLQRVGPGLTSLQDIRFDGYREAGDGWIAPEVRFAVDSVLTMVELYDSIQVDVPVPDGFFDPAEYGATPHWSENQGRVN